MKIECNKSQRYKTKTKKPKLTSSSEANTINVWDQVEEKISGLEDKELEMDHSIK